MHPVDVKKMVLSALPSTEILSSEQERDAFEVIADAVSDLEEVALENRRRGEGAKKDYDKIAEEVVQLRLHVVTMTEIVNNLIETTDKLMRHVDISRNERESKKG